MNYFAPQYFFDLLHFEQAELFRSCSYVWEALPLIKTYLLNCELGKIDVDIPEGAFLVNPELISIGEGTIVEPGSYIKGPCIIGKKCQIRHGAYIRGNFIAGNECVIGHDTEVKNSILLDSAQAAHFAYLGDTIVGNRVNLGAGTKCANLRLDHKNVAIRYEDRLIETNLKKFGAIIGDDCQLGCNSVTNPGTLLGKWVIGYPCLNISGFVPSGQLIRASNTILITPLQRP